MGIYFAEKGFHCATIKDIVRQAGIVDDTIYIYFACKAGRAAPKINR